MFTRIFILTLSLLLVGKAWAYSKDNHEWLTQEAAKFAYLCANQDFSDDVVNALISFNRDQDELLRKSDMWHFPPPLGNDPKTSKSVEWAIASFFVMNTDFSVWVEYLSDSIQEKGLGMVAATGSLLHYIQDVAVPAHAIPVFHPTSIVFAETDGFDDWDEFNSIDLSLKDCSKIKEVGDISNIVHEVRIKTLDTLKGKGGIQPSWARHWNLNINSKGFGSYNCSSDAFGKEHGLDCLENAPYISTAKFKEVATSQAELAILASAKLIYYTITSCQGCPPKGCNFFKARRMFLPSTTLLEKLNHLYRD